MFTHAYRNGWIHGYCDRQGCWARFADYSRRWCRSYRAAQIAITRKGA